MRPRARIPSLALALALACEAKPTAPAEPSPGEGSVSSPEPEAGPAPPPWEPATPTPITAAELEPPVHTSTCEATRVAFPHRYRSLAAQGEYVAWIDSEDRLAWSRTGETPSYAPKGTGPSWNSLVIDGVDLYACGSSQFYHVRFPSAATLHTGGCDHIAIDANEIFVVDQSHPSEAERGVYRISKTDFSRTRIADLPRKSVHGLHASSGALYVHGPEGIDRSSLDGAWKALLTRSMEYDYAVADTLPLGTILFWVGMKYPQGSSRPPVHVYRTSGYGHARLTDLDEDLQGVALNGDSLVGATPKGWTRRSLPGKHRVQTYTLPAGAEMGDLIANASEIWWTERRESVELLRLPTCGCDDASFPLRVVERGASTPAPAPDRRAPFWLGQVVDGGLVFAVALGDEEQCAARSLARSELALALAPTLTERHLEQHEADDARVPARLRKGTQLIAVGAEGQTEVEITHFFVQDKPSFRAYVGVRLESPLPTAPGGAVLVLEPDKPRAELRLRSPIPLTGSEPALIALRSGLLKAAFATFAEERGLLEYPEEQLLDTDWSLHVAPVNLPGGGRWLASVSRFLPDEGWLSGVAIADERGEIIEWIVDIDHPHGVVIEGVTDFEGDGVDEFVLSWRTLPKGQARQPAAVWGRAIGEELELTDLDGAWW